MAGEEDDGRVTWVGLVRKSAEARTDAVARRICVQKPIDLAIRVGAVLPRNGRLAASVASIEDGRRERIDQRIIGDPDDELRAPW